MSDRESHIRRFLRRAGWAEAVRQPLAGDASFRRYERLATGPRRTVLMDAPPATEDVRPFIRIARHLKRLGFSAPDILAADEKAGLLLLEDLGDATYTRMLEDGADETILYSRAVDLLIDLHSRPLAEVAAAGLDRYDDEKLLDEAALLVDWYRPAVSVNVGSGPLPRPATHRVPSPKVITLGAAGRGSGLERSEQISGEETPEAPRHDYLETWRAAFSPLDALPRTLVLRDYHVDNLMWLEGREGVAACGLLDFQDAVIGPAPYDLVSLLEDARRDLAPGLEAAMKARYLAAFPDLDREAFETAYRILGAQRNAKIIGIFTRLALRDAKPGYLHHIPRVWRLLERDLAHPSLGPLREWLDRHLPKQMRGIPARQAGA